GRSKECRTKLKPIIPSYRPPEAFPSINFQFRASLEGQLADERRRCKSGKKTTKLPVWSLTFHR
ncbi:hypothetical protein LINPERPRIM_LOCUS39797, partial [Linum perenne]